MNIVEKARLIATTAHGAIGQVRKYTHDPYIVHPTAVVDLLYLHGVNDETTIATAWLHDVLEDTKLDYFDLATMIGARVTGFVCELTDENDPKKNRATRKAEDRARLASSCYGIQSIKCADLIDNTRSIVQYDPKFAVTYLKEKEELLKVLTKAEPRLLEEAWKVLRESLALLDEQRLQTALRMSASEATK